MEHNPFINGLPIFWFPMAMLSNQMVFFFVDYQIIKGWPCCRECTEQRNQGHDKEFSCHLGYVPYGNQPYGLLKTKVTRYSSMIFPARNLHKNSDWLVVTGTFGLFFHSVGNVIIPTDELHHFSEGWHHHLHRWISQPAMFKQTRGYPRSAAFVAFAPGLPRFFFFRPALFQTISGLSIPYATHGAGIWIPTFALKITQVCR